MILKLNRSLLIIIFSYLFYSCEKEYSLEGNGVGGTAVFSFAGSPGTCTNAVVSGTYRSGTALGAANTITISVNVSTPGTYTVSSATVNGISFSGTGIFTATGLQTITLTGTGIPVNPGTFSFTPGAAGCSFSVTISSGGGSGGTAVYTFNGAPGNCTNFSAGGTYAAGTALGTTNFAVVNVNVSTVGTYVITSNTVNGIYFSANGTFTTPGSQLIQLTGSGTPLAAGTFNYTPGTNGCTFSVTVTGGNSGAAVFTYNGAPGSCTNPAPGGTYIPGTALTALNTVTLSVNVTRIGTYSVSTPQVNGILFSGSGSFLTTGPQNIILSGTGAPSADGVFNFTPTGNGCSFPITVVAVTTDFLKCTIDGATRNFNLNLVGASPDPTTFALAGDETLAANSRTFSIGLLKTPAITSGSYNRISVTNTNALCLVNYTDGVSPTGWATGVLQSGGFTVVVTSFTANRIEGTFSGTLYDNDGQGSISKTVTNGQFSLPY